MLKGLDINFVLKLLFSFDKENFITRSIKKDLLIREKEEWDSLSIEHLTEDFMIEFKEKIDWKNISKCKSLSENSIREFRKQCRLGMCFSMSTSLRRLHPRVPVQSRMVQHFSISKVVRRVHS